MAQFYGKQIMVPALTAMVLGGVMAAAQPPLARAADPAPATQAAKDDSAAKEDKGAAQPVDRAEARIKELRAKLHITAAQEPKWNDLVQVMRDNAQQMSALIEQRDQNAKTATAVDDLKTYEQITEAHEDGLKKLLPAFQALYDSLSDAQKKAADSLFRNNTAKRGAS